MTSNIYPCYLSEGLIYGTIKVIRRASCRTLTPETPGIIADAILSFQLRELRIGVSKAKIGVVNIIRPILILELRLQGTVCRNRPLLFTLIPDYTVHFDELSLRLLAEGSIATVLYLMRKHALHLDIRCFINV